MSELSMPYIEDECPMCCNKKPLGKFVCKNCSDGMYGTGEELTDLKRRLHEAVDDVKEKCTMYDVDGANTALLILKKHLPELEE